MSSQHAAAAGRSTQARGYLLTGALLSGGAAMLFATKGILAKGLYARAVSYDALVFVRAVLALPLFWAFAVWREGWGTVRSTPPSALAWASFAGVLCYYVGAMTDFLALTMIEASIERVLLFSYPAVVVLLTSVLSRRWPSPLAVGGALATYVGIFFAVGGLDTAELSANARGAGLVLISALSYAIYFIVGERATRSIGSTRFTLFSMTAATVALALHFALLGDATALRRFDMTSWWLLLALAVFCMFVPALMQSEGMRRIGAQRGSVVSTLGPPTTLLLGWAVLGERLTAMQVFGVVLIVGSVLVIELLRMSPR